MRLSIAMTSWPSREEAVAEVGAEESGAARDEHPHAQPLPTPA